MADDVCPVCEGAHPTTWILTHLSPPATVRSCEQDIIVNLITMLAIELDMPAAVLYEIIETTINAPIPDVEPVPEPSAEVKPKRTRKPRMAVESVEEVAGDAVEA